MSEPLIEPPKEEDKGTTNIELIQLAKTLQIKYFRGVFMRDELPKMTINPNGESGIVNVNSADKNDSGLWLSYYKEDKQRIAYSTFGEPIIQELIDYLHKPILTSDHQTQSIEEVNCGERCILKLWLLSRGKKFEDIILDF